MGNCVKKHKTRKIPDVSQKEIQRSVPEVFLVENFKIVDYTDTLKDLKEITDIKNYFVNYKPSDIRCVRRKNENKQDHSHLMITFNQIINGQVIDEVGLIADYSLYGFAISIGEIEDLKNICHLKSFELELLHLPKADNQEKVSLADVIEWAYEHKDEMYQNPKKVPELNMGKRLFFYITNSLSDDKRI